MSFEVFFQLKELWLVGLDIVKRKERAEILELAVKANYSKPLH